MKKKSFKDKITKQYLMESPPELTLWQRITYSKEEKEKVKELDLLWNKACMAGLAEEFLEKLGADQDMLDKADELTRKAYEEYRKAF